METPNKLQIIIDKSNQQTHFMFEVKSMAGVPSLMSKSVTSFLAALPGPVLNNSFC